MPSVSRSCRKIYNWLGEYVGDSEVEEGVNASQSDLGSWTTAVTACDGFRFVQRGVGGVHIF